MRKRGREGGRNKGVLYFAAVSVVDLIHIIIIVFSGEYERQQNSLQEQTREQQVTIGEVLAYPWSLVEVYSAHPLKVNPRPGFILWVLITVCRPYQWILYDNS